jgi:HD superfamily phosphohydrolase
LPEKTQRVRDPVHDLIVFQGTSSVDQLAWRLLNTPPFQRLRRIKQLGFSELVYPGATHTRFAHCIGVFANARRLIDVVKRKMGTIDESKATAAVIAALLHDLGHGPFSHTFEGVEKQRRVGKSKKHELWTRDILEQHSSIRALLDDYDTTLAPEVGKMLTRKDPVDIYDSIVSSQFDADRLDYLPRDRYMSGIGGGQFDSAWMLDSLEVGDITVGLEGEEKDYVTVPSRATGQR